MRVTITVVRDNEYSTRTLRLVTEGLAYMFGGVTVREGYGAWLDNDGVLVYNKVWTAETYVQDDDRATVGWQVHELSAEAANILNEDTVMYTLDDKPYFT